jgi:hypothetical protein
MEKGVHPILDFSGSGGAAVPLEAQAQGHKFV